MESVENAGAQARIVAAARRTVVGALAALLLTTAHHLYGAYIYATPWRTHVAHVSVLAAATLIGSLVVLQRRAGTAAGAVALWSILLVTLALPVVGIGLFEGGYNHVLKVALYYGHASPGLMARLFPPPAYELPNDALFEITGVLQLALGALAGRHLILLARERSRLATPIPGRADEAITAQGEGR
jgi:hypothetical protein